MADKLGINTEGLDLSEAITKPYTITSAKPQTIKSMADLNKELKVTDQWEGISTQPIDLTKIEEAGVTLERAIQDLAVNVPATAAEMVGETIEHPLQKAATYTAEAMGFAKGSALAGKYITGAGKLAAAGRAAGGLAGAAAGGVVALAPTFLSSGGAPLPQDNSKILVYGEDEPKEWKEVKEILNGAEYPVNSIAHDMLAWGARYKEARQALREYQASKQGIDPEYWSNQLLQGGVSIIPAIAVGKVAYGATAKAKTKQITDALTGKTEKVLTNKARKQASETAVKAAQVFTTEQMSVDYIEGDIQDYIDKTGDLTLQGFNINSVEAAQAYTYGMLGNYIEFGLGGAEAVALGAWKRAGLKMSMKTGQAIAKTALEEGAEEGLQNITEFMSRKIDGTTNKTWGDALKESLQTALYGAGIGGAVGGTSYRIGRNNLAKIYKKALPNITHEQAIQMAEDTIENSAKALSPENAEVRKIIRKNIDTFYTFEGSEVDEYDKEAMVDELMINMQRKATRDGTTIAELPEIQNAIVDQIAWWIKGRPTSVETDVRKIIDKQAQMQERLKELQDTTERTEEMNQEMDALEEQLEMADRLQWSVQKLVELNKKVNALQSIIKKAQQKAEKVEKDAQKQAEKEKKAKDRETARVLEERARRQRLMNNYELEFATDESLRQALINAGEDKRIVNRMKHRSLVKLAKLNKIQSDQIVLRDEKKIQEEIAFKEEERRRKALGIMTPKQFFFGKINLQFALDQGLVEAFGFDRTATHNIAMYRYFKKDGGFSDWTDLREDLIVSGYLEQDPMTSSYAEEVDKDERVKEMVFGKEIRRMDTKAEARASAIEQDANTFTPSEIEFLQSEGIAILEAAGVSREEIAKMDYQELTDKLNEIYEAKSQEQQPEYGEDVDPDDIPVDWQFAGENAATANKAKRQEAETMEAEGKTPIEIWQQTGWYRGADGMWRFEIADNEAEINQKTIDKAKRNITADKDFVTTTIGELLEHKQLFAAYPALKKVSVVVDLKGKFVKGTVLANVTILKGRTVMFVAPKILDQTQKLKSVTLHEIQHMIQKIEDFARGGSTEEFIGRATDPGKAYRSLYGEVEARNTQARADLTKEERYILPPETTQDVKTTDTIVLTQGEFLDPDIKWNSEEFEIREQTKPGKTGKKRGAYFPELDAIARTNNADATSLLHEFAHYFFEDNMRKYNAGGGSEQWRADWKKTIDALGVPENAGPKQWRKASEAFARGYEAWLMNKDKKVKIAVDKDEEPQEAAYTMFQSHIKDIYDSIYNPYFEDAWTDRVGELKPEIIAWFEQMSGTSTRQGQIARKEITPAQATALTTLETVASTVPTTTSKYEVEGGNVNRPKTALEELALEIDETNIDIKGDKYDTHRDMLQVAKDADTFVNTRPEEAMAIINGLSPEVEDLFREDLFTAMKRKAMRDGDLNLIRELYDSRVAQDLAKEAGQRVVAFKDFTSAGDIDIFGKLNALDQNYNKAYNTEKGKEKIDSAIKDLQEQINKQDTISDQQLDEILKEMECQ